MERLGRGGTGRCRAGPAEFEGPKDESESQRTLGGLGGFA